MKRDRTKSPTCADIVHHEGEDLDLLCAGDIYVRLRRHLAQCPNCEAYIDSLNKVIRLYRRYPDPRLKSKMRKRLHTIISLTH